MLRISRYALLLCIALTSTRAVPANGNEAPATQEEISLWRHEGTQIGATHLIVVCDRFDFSDFPDYVYPGQDVQEKVYDWNSQDLFMVMNVYSISPD